MPMTYFADVRDRPAYCAAHLLPLQAMPADLARAATTPDFAWVSPDDCSDMEGCGIAAGDGFLRAELGAIMRSPAWRTQRSLAIITFDEDGADHRAAGPAGRDRHDRLRRRAAGLCIPRSLHPLQPAQNNRGRARPRPDDGERPVCAAGQRRVPAWSGRAGFGGQRRERRDERDHGREPQHCPRSCAAGGHDGGRQRQVRCGRSRRGCAGAAAANRVRGELSVRHRQSGQPGHAAGLSRHPGRPRSPAIAITPAGATAYVVNSGSDSVTPIATATRRAGRRYPGRPRSAIHRDSPGRRDRVRHQRRLGLGHSDRPGQRNAGSADPGRRGAAGDRDHAGRHRPRSCSTGAAAR